MMPNQTHTLYPVNNMLNLKKSKASLHSIISLTQIKLLISSLQDMYSLTT